MSEEQIRVTADDSEAQAIIARADAQVTQLGAKVDLADLRVAQSLSSAVAGLTALANVGLAAFKVFGVAIDESLQALIGVLLGYAQQMAMIATSTSIINPAYAAALATAALVVEGAAYRMQAEGAREAREKLDDAQRLMSQVTQSLIIFTRSRS